MKLPKFSAAASFLAVSSAESSCLRHGIAQKPAVKPPGTRTKVGIIRDTDLSCGALAETGLRPAVSLFAPLVAVHQIHQ